MKIAAASILASHFLNILKHENTYDVKAILQTPPIY